MENKKTGILSYGVVRGLIGQVIGTAVGLGVFALLRLILGMGWNPGRTGAEHRARLGLQSWIPSLVDEMLQGMAARDRNLRLPC